MKKSNFSVPRPVYFWAVSFFQLLVINVGTNKNQGELLQLAPTQTDSSNNIPSKRDILMHPLTIEIHRMSHHIVTYLMMFHFIKIAFCP